MEFGKPLEDLQVSVVPTIPQPSLRSLWIPLYLGKPEIFPFCTSNQL